MRPHNCRKGVVDFSQHEVLQPRNGSGCGRKAERFEEPFLALAQSVLRSAAPVKIGEGEEHAGLFGNRDGFASDDNQPVASRYRDKRLPLADDLAFMQPLQRVLAGVAFGKQSKLLDAHTDNVLTREAGHFKKALIDADETLVFQPADQARGGIGVKGAFKARFGLKTGCFIPDDEDEDVGPGTRVLKNKATHRVDPALLLIAAR